MATDKDLEQKIRQLEQLIIKQQTDTKALLTKSDRALDEAIHAYHIDHAGYVWVWDPEQKHYRKTDVCVHVIIPKVKPKEITSIKIADGAIIMRTLAKDVLDYISKQISNVVSALRIKHKEDVDCLNKRITCLGKKHCKDMMAIEHEMKDLRNQIDAHSDHGGFVSNRFGDDPHIAVSQKTATSAINMIWQKLEDMTGEMLQGIIMLVTPDYFISEDGATVHVTANTAETNGIFEEIAFYGNGALIAQYENTEYVEFDHHIDETTVIMCKAKIMGIEYTRQRVITHYNSFWIGAGNSYEDIMDVEHVIPITNGLRGGHDVAVGEDQHIIIILGDTLRGGFDRADISFAEIKFTETTVTVDGNNYIVLISEDTYQEGTYRVFING